MKKPLIGFIVADNNNLKYAEQLINSIRKFHSAEQFPIEIIGQKEIDEYLKTDPAFFYRATPVVASKYIKEYETVVKLDADQICFGDLNHVLSLSYDVGVVLNINRVDPQTYGFVTCCNIEPRKYFNAGFVAMKSEAFVEHWLDLCYSEYFDRFQYREQDLLNIMCHFGTYKVEVLDLDDWQNNYYAWHGLIAKGETARAVLINGEVVIPQGDEASNFYPEKNVILKLWHTAGGHNEQKVNYRIWFPEEIQKHIEYLISK